MSHELKALINGIVIFLSFVGLFGFVIDPYQWRVSVTLLASAIVVKSVLYLYSSYRDSYPKE